MSPNNIFPFPKESDTSSERSLKKVGIWIISNTHCSLQLTRFSKKGILKWLTNKGNKKILWRNPSLLLFHKKSKLTQSKKQRNHKHPIKQYIHQKAIKLTQLNHQKNQGLLKELTQQTQQINQGLFQDQIVLIKVPEQKTPQKYIPTNVFKCF